MSRSRESTPLTSRPPISILPSLSSSSPASSRSAVVLPEPDGPTSTMKPPSGTSRLRWSTASLSLPAYRQLTS